MPQVTVLKMPSFHTGLKYSDSGTGMTARCFLCMEDGCDGAVYPKMETSVSFLRDMPNQAANARTPTNLRNSADPMGAQDVG